MSGRGEAFDLGRLPADIIWLDSSDSTNDYLKHQSSSRDTRVALSWNQTAGRGRMGREWISPAGESLAVSIDLGDLVPDDVGDSWRGALPLLVAAELAHNTHSTLSVPAEVKWPNDVLIDGKKVAGILGELPEPGRVIIGIGINVWGAPEGLGGSPVTSLSAHGLSEKDCFVGFAENFLQSLLGRLKGIRQAVSPEDWDFVRTHLSTLGRQVRVSFPGGSEIRGVAEDIDSQGRLVVTTGTRTEVISAGDIEHLRAL